MSITSISRLGPARRRAEAEFSALQSGAVLAAGQEPSPPVAEKPFRPDDEVALQRQALVRRGLIGFKTAQPATLKR